VYLILDLRPLLIKAVIAPRTQRRRTYNFNLRMSGSDENGSPNTAEKPEGAAVSEHLNIKVTDNNNEVFFKIKRTTQLKKLMDAFCERQGKAPNSVRFLFDGSRVQATDSPDTVSIISSALHTLSRNNNHMLAILSH
jgi:hypothetical protein